MRQGTFFTFEAKKNITYRSASPYFHPCPVHSLLSHMEDFIPCGRKTAKGPFQGKYLVHWKVVVELFSSVCVAERKH